MRWPMSLQLQLAWVHKCAFGVWFGSGFIRSPLLPSLGLGSSVVTRFTNLAIRGVFWACHVDRFCHTRRSSSCGGTFIRLEVTCTLSPRPGSPQLFLLVLWVEPEFGILSTFLHSSRYAGGVQTAQNELRQEAKPQNPLVAGSDHTHQ